MKKILFAAVIAATVFAATRGGQHESTKLAFDRIWIDHMPRGERDPVQIFVAIDEHAFGQFATTSRWQGNWEGFRFEANGDEVRAVFPQTGKREQMTLGAKACDARGFDYCLEITGSEHGAKRYYSRKDWIIEPRADIESQVQAILAP